MDVNGSNTERIVGVEQLSDYDLYNMGLEYFEVFAGYVYIRAPYTSLLRYNLETEQTEMFLNDVGSYAFVGDYCYFVEHAMRTYSIFRKDIYSGELELIRGDGIIKSDLSPEERNN
jgi:hypothetical protein